MARPILVDQQRNGIFCDKIPELHSLVCLYHENITDIRKSIDIAMNATYNMIIAPIANPQLLYRNTDRSSSDSNKYYDIFTRSDLLLCASEWYNRIIFKVSEPIDCDSSDTFIRLHSEQILHQEIGWAKYLAEYGCSIIRLQNDNSINLAKCVTSAMGDSGCVLMEIPLIDLQHIKRRYRRKMVERDGGSENISTSMWQRWNKFRLYADFNRHIKVLLEVTPEVPNELELLRWLGEPIEMISLPSHLFRLNSSDPTTVTLPDCYRDFCRKFVEKLGVHFVIKCNVADQRLSAYAKCVRMLLAEVYAIGQPLHRCNNDEGNITILMVERQQSINKCVKHIELLCDLYGKAVKCAVEDRIDSEMGKMKVYVMIVGFGGYDLLKTILTALNDVKQRIKIFIYDEDINVVFTIEEKIKLLYPNEVIIIINNRHMLQYHSKMDIIVSLSLETIYQSQWLQYDFDRVGNYAKPNAILIPKHSTVSIVPIMSSSLYNELRKPKTLFNWREPTEPMDYEIRVQNPYNVYTRNYYNCCTDQVLFTFDFRSSECEMESFASTSHTRFTTLTFNAKQECIVNGFLTYFEAVLYGDIKLSHRHMETVKNATCLPLNFYPLSDPQWLRANDTFKVHFWLVMDATMHRFWYEWSTSEPQISRIHNLKGECGWVEWK